MLKGSGYWGERGRAVDGEGSDTMVGRTRDEAGCTGVGVFFSDEAVPLNFSANPSPVAISSGNLWLC
jgi:hypothetical protein